MAEDVVIVGGARTPFCEWQGGKRGDGQPGGLLKDVSALKLGEIAIKGALEKTGTSAENVDVDSSDVSTQGLVTTSPFCVDVLSSDDSWGYISVS